MLDTTDNLKWCERLFEEQAGNLILYGRSLGLSHAEAEDLVQEIFAALVQMPEVPERPAHYAVRALRNRAINFRRSFVRRVLREIESVRWFEKGPTESLPERIAMRCLSDLPQEQREVIVLKIWHGHTFEEIGEIAGISPNTAAGRYRYGIQKLRACLTENAYEQERFFGDSDGLLDSAPTIPKA